MSFVDRANVAMTAGCSVTLSGLSVFGDIDLISSSAYVGLTSCQTAAWASSTSVACHVAAGDGVSHLVTAIVMGVVGTRPATFSYDGASAPREQRLATLWYLAGLAFQLFHDSYDYKASHLRHICRMPAPAVSFAALLNGAVTAGHSVTVSGLSFAISGTTPTASIGASGCLTTTWASTTSMVCMLPGGEGVGHEIRVTAAGVVGSRTSTFSYDGLLTS